MDVSNDHNDCWGFLEDVWYSKRDENLRPISVKHHLRGSGRGDLESYCERKFVFLRKTRKFKPKNNSLWPHFSLLLCIVYLHFALTKPLHWQKKYLLNCKEQHNFSTNKATPLNIRFLLNFVRDHSHGLCTGWIRISRHKAEWKENRVY